MDKKEVYLEYLKDIIENEEDVIYFSKFMTDMENVLMPVLLKDEEIAAYITWNWKIKIEDFRQRMDLVEGKLRFTKDVKNGVEGAVKLWMGCNLLTTLRSDLIPDVFENWEAHHEVIRNREANEIAEHFNLVLRYIISFCRFKISNNEYIIFDPFEYNPSELKEKLTIRERSTDTIGSSILGTVLGIPGIGILAKWEEHDTKKRQRRMFYNEVGQINFFSIVFELSSELQEMRNVLQYEIENR
ncbi:hypothetical protein [Planococcus alpniumensis]|uniref:hypothetical protein n=1 Tax=Planococcus alpniumensis TaxID=2708345 RepID=UPI001B8B4A9C|nr:hypothetical protein [Planococcus sp. MSAK28401]